MKEYKPYKEGKVRELYDLGDSLVMVCTDRISAFDKILDTDIPEKGAILNCMSRFWFDHTRDIVPNHMISTDTAAGLVIRRMVTYAVFRFRQDLKNVRSFLNRFSHQAPRLRWENMI